MIPLAAFFAAALASVATLALMLRSALRHWSDVPNHRSLHRVPVPRIGGLGIHVGWIVALGGAAAAGAFPDATGARVAGAGVAVGVALVVGVSLLDDRRSIPPVVRLVVQALAAALLVAGLGVDAVRQILGTLGPEVGGPAPSMLPLVAGVALVLAILWAMNLFNFMDGADGLAGGMALFGCGSYALLAAPAAPEVGVAAAAIAGGAAGFLAFNFPPARVFMGDAGSVPLGYLAAAIGLAGIAAGAWGAWLPPLLFLPFIADATLTLARRALRGERVWEAHREHAYQKLILLGWSHRRNALAWWAAMAACAALAVVLQRATPRVQWAGLAMAAAAAVVILASIEVAWRRSGARSSP